MVALSPEKKQHICFLFGAVFQRNHLVDNQETKIELVSNNRLHHVNSWVRRHKGKDSPKNQPPWTQECTHTHTRSQIHHHRRYQYNQHTHTNMSSTKLHHFATNREGTKKRHIKSSQTKFKTSWSKHEKNDLSSRSPSSKSRRFETNERTIWIFCFRWKPRSPSAWVRFFSCFKKTSKNLAKNGDCWAGWGCLGYSAVPGWFGMLGCVRR